jgi:hypothetical protein
MILQTESGFPYRMAMGELIFAIVIVRVDLSFFITKLSQYNASPTKCHYQAVKDVSVYLLDTRTQPGSHLLVQRTLSSSPWPPPPTIISDPCHRLQQPDTIPTGLTGYTDSDWGSDRSHRCSISGIIILLAAAAVFNKTKFQKAVALSSTEAEFVSASDSGKMLLHLWSFLKDLGFEQPNPTHMNQDNRGTIHMANAQAQTHCCRHIDIRYFALLQCLEDGNVIFVPVPTDLNVSDSLTKASTGHISISMPISTWAASHRHMLPTAVLSVSPEFSLFLLHTLILAMFDYDWCRIKHGGEM